MSSPGRPSEAHSGPFGRCLRRQPEGPRVRSSRPTARIPTTRAPPRRRAAAALWARAPVTTLSSTTSARRWRSRIRSTAGSGTNPRRAANRWSVGSGPRTSSRRYRGASAGTASARRSSASPDGPTRRGHCGDDVPTADPRVLVRHELGGPRLEQGREPPRVRGPHLGHRCVLVAAEPPVQAIARAVGHDRHRGTSVIWSCRTSAPQQKQCANRGSAGASQTMQRPSNMASLSLSDPERCSRGEKRSCGDACPEAGSRNAPTGAGQPGASRRRPGPGRRGGAGGTCRSSGSPSGPSPSVTVASA